MTMQRIRHLFIPLLTAAALLAGCGGGGGSSFSSDEASAPEERAMEIGRPYTMHSGEMIVRRTDDAVVTIETDLRTGETVATLQSGRAIIR
jgi:hypothetical protein